MERPPDEGHAKDIATVGIWPWLSKGLVAFGKSINAKREMFFSLVGSNGMREMYVSLKKLTPSLAEHPLMIKLRVQTLTFQN